LRQTRNQAIFELPSHLHIHDLVRVFLWGMSHDVPYRGFTIFVMEDNSTIGHSMASSIMSWGRGAWNSFIEKYLVTRTVEVRKEVAKKYLPEKYAKLGVTLIGILFAHFILYVLFLILFLILLTILADGKGCIVQFSKKSAETRYATKKCLVEGVEQDAGG
jgi:hypothetical protein